MMRSVHDHHGHNNSNLLLSLLVLAVSQLLLSSWSSSSPFGALFVQAANFENTTVTTLKNQKIKGHEVQQVQGKILYDSGYVDLSTLVFTVTPPATADADSSAAAAAAAGEEFFYMDLAILQVPEICSDNVTTAKGVDVNDSSNHQDSNCKWAAAYTLGLSVASAGMNSLGEPEVWWCCDQNAMDYGACTPEQYGRLLINETLFRGQRASLPIPMSGVMVDVDTGLSATFSSLLPPEAAGFGFTQAGMYTLIMANCQEGALDIVVNGDITWVSFDEMEVAKEAIPFYVILGIGYAVLLSWFWYLLQANKSSRIKLEEWIFGTIALGFFEMLFLTIEFFAMGSAGSRLPILSLIATIVSAAKHSFGRCLLLMVAMGWGVVRASLARHTFMGIVAMGTFYLVASAMFDIYYTIDWSDDSNNDNNKDSSVESFGGEEQETEIGDFVQVCFWLSFYIDIVFLIWIPSAMCQTMHYLKTTNQLRKLERYQTLLKIMIVSVVLTIVTIILVFSGAFGLSFMDIGEGNEFNFFIMLTFVAVVWRPNPNAREFAYAMELGTGDDDNDNGTTDLELVADSACDFQQQHQQSKRSNNGTYEGGGAVSIDRAEPA